MPRDISRTVKRMWRKANSGQSLKTWAKRTDDSLVAEWRRNKKLGVTR